MIHPIAHINNFNYLYKMEYTYKYNIEKLRGTKINKLTILEEGEKIREGGKNRRTFICRCNCGNEKQVQVRLLMNNTIKSCGNCPPEDRTGETRGYLEIIKEVQSKNSARRFEVKCNNCGTHKEMNYAIFNKKTHCGCLTEKKPILRRPLAPLKLPILKGIFEITEEVGIERGEGVTKRIVNCKCTKCGQEKIRVYRDIDFKVKHCGSCKQNGVSASKLTEDEKRLSNPLSNMKLRCFNKSSKDYKNYGARGIKVCDEWTENIVGKRRFREWALANGYREGLEIDRIDNDGNYEPSNCRFITRKENGRNKRTVKLTEQDVKDIRYGRFKDIKDELLSEVLQVSLSTLEQVRDFKSWIDI